MIHLAFIDILLIVCYFCLVLYVGFRSAKKPQGEEEDYLLAGRSLTLPVFVMTLVSTWYGGILGVGEFSYRYGISNWVVQGIPYYVFAGIFALVLAKKIRETNLYSIPDKLEAAYDKKTALLGAGLTFILMTPAPYVLMLSVFLNMLFGWNLILSLAVTGVVSVSYLYLGGFQSDVDTDIIEFILMFAGFIVIIPFCAAKLGGFEYLVSHVPPLHLTWHGGNSMQFILVWFFIALWTLVDPAFHQRCYAAKDGATAQKGILISIVFWFLFDAMTATAGLYAKAALPDLKNPVMAFPSLAEAVLPPVAKGLFYIGMLATIMSTLNTLAFVSAQTLGRDILMRLKIRDKKIIPDDLDKGNQEILVSNPSYLNSLLSKLKSDSGIILTKIGLIVSFIISIIIAVAIPSVIKIWYTIGTVIVPGLLVPLIASYFDRLRISARFAFLAMFWGCLTSTIWLLAGTGDDYPLGMEPMYPGLVISILLWGMGRVDIERTEKLEANNEIPD